MPVKFTIGGIIVGEAPAKAVMTPIDLSATAKAGTTTPDIVARTQRFLVQIQLMVSLLFLQTPAELQRIWPLTLQLIILPKKLPTCQNNGEGV